MADQFWCIRRKQDVWDTEVILSAKRQEKIELAQHILKSMIQEDAKDDHCTEILKRKIVFLFFRILRNLSRFWSKMIFQGLMKKIIYDGNMLVQSSYDRSAQLFQMSKYQKKKCRE